MKRRTFLKMAGLGSFSIAAGCSSEVEKTLYSLVQAPDDRVTGRAAWYATTCRECPAGCGTLAKNREGRVIKLEGNPIHPINMGKLCMRGQAALQGVYNPDRISTPLIKNKDTWKPISFEQAEVLLNQKATDALKKGIGRVRLMTELVGPAMSSLFSKVLKSWHSAKPVIFEPYAYEALKFANREVFNVDGIASYHMEKADVLLSFGADFLETWLSPVEYARKFKAMHWAGLSRKHFFYHISPVRSLTAANADQWLACNLETESAVVLGLIREVLEAGKGKTLPASFRRKLKKTVSTYTQEKVIRISKIHPEQYETLIYQLVHAQAPLVLGTSAAASGINTVWTDVAVNLLNVVLDPQLKLMDFNRRHRVEKASRRSDVMDFFKSVENDPVDLLLLNHVNPVYSLPSGDRVSNLLHKESLFVVSFSSFMDETTQSADLIFPVQFPIETWDIYDGRYDAPSSLQPAMGKLTKAPGLGDVFLRAVPGDKNDGTYKDYLYDHLNNKGIIKEDREWMTFIRTGGRLTDSAVARGPLSSVRIHLPEPFINTFPAQMDTPALGASFTAAPSVRFFDGRGANRPWLCEIPDPLTKVAWDTPVLIHPKSADEKGVKEGDVVQIKSEWGQLEAPAYVTPAVKPGILAMAAGQGHQAFGRYAEGIGKNPIPLFSPDTDPNSGGPYFSISQVRIQTTGRVAKLPRTDGSRLQYGRKIALSATWTEVTQPVPEKPYGLTMNDFPLTLPIPEGYDPKRDIYPPHDHDKYRWAMVIDLDRCIGCGACVAACYAENNLGVVGPERIVEGREMSWIRIERYQDSVDTEKVIFFPMLCQHCDNAPCEAVCPVYATHHSKEGLNNQIYNRCIGTRFCAQNCPYKVRRFNWFDWKRPKPLNLQLNPNVTVRSKGVMEKCSFCVQRIKAAHGKAKDENRMIEEGDVVPACVQTCPTEAFTFGNLMDKNSRVRQLTADPRAYQAMGYLNTKPAVIYLKKIIRDI